MKKVKRIIGFIAAACLCNTASADWAGYFSVHQLYSQADGSALFGINGTPANTCSFFGERFIFDSTTNAGKSMLSILLTAKVTDKNISIWYHPATATGNETNGCGPDKMARVTGISIE